MIAPVTITSAEDLSPQAPAASSGAAFSLADVMEHLNGSRWMVELRPLFGRESDEPAHDLVTFEQGLMHSQLLSPDGFGPARFAVTLTDGAAPVWEAMQSSPRTGVAIWRGELHGEEMRGVVSKQPLEGDSQDYLFVGHRMRSSDRPEVLDVPPLIAAPQP